MTIICLVVYREISHGKDIAEHSHDLFSNVAVYLAAKYQTPPQKPTRISNTNI